MRLQKSQIGGLLFLALFISYGIAANNIPLDFLSQQDIFNARSLPYAISVAGALVSLLLILQAIRTPSDPTDDPRSKRFFDLNWFPTLALVVVMFVYALILDYVGFLIATTVFLIAGYWIMGERNPLILFLMSLPLVVGIWLMMAGLGVYLAPGNLYFDIMGS